MNATEWGISANGPPYRISGETITASGRWPTHRPGDRSTARPAGFRKILVPVTLSTTSHAAVAVALNLVRETGGMIVLLHVLQLNIVTEERGIARTRLLNDLRGEAEEHLSRLAERTGTSAPLEVVVCEGRAAETIIEQAGRLEADMIVMCTHGYRGWRKWLHRNTALRVLRQTPCPLWLVSPGKPEPSFVFTLVDRATTAQPAPPPVRHESYHPFRSVLRVLFS